MSHQLLERISKLETELQKLQQIDAKIQALTDQVNTKHSDVQKKFDSILE